MSNNNNNERHSNSHFITNKTHLQCPSWLRIHVFHGRPHLAAHETQVPGWNKSPGFGRPTNAAFSMAAIVRFCLQRFSNIGTIKKIRHSMIDHLITSQKNTCFFSLSIKYLPKKTEQQKNGVIQAAAPAAPHGVANDPAPQCRHSRRSSRPLAMPGDLQRFHQRNSGRKTQHFDDNDNESWINDHE